ncbi:MAG: zinc ribbon domain-containing protein [Anaerolineae bacterium]|nr:zinc ribbon domain-containing protein [Anaerolineae bacterium]
MILSQPFQSRPRTSQDEVLAEDSVASQRSALMANRDQVLDALQELDFDHTLGKIPEEAYQSQRVVLLRHGTQVLRQLDEIDSTVQPQEDAESRLENAIASRRADGRQVVTRPGDEDLEDLLAARRRARQVKSAGFCPKCGKPAQTTDQFCSRCGSNLEESA